MRTPSISALARLLLALTVGLSQGCEQLTGLDGYGVVDDQDASSQGPGDDAEAGDADASLGPDRPDAESGGEDASDVDGSSASAGGSGTEAGASNDAATDGDASSHGDSAGPVDQDSGTGADAHVEMDASSGTPDADAGTDAGAATDDAGDAQTGPQTITVAGRVTNYALLPFAGAKVRIGTTTVTSDAQGNFRIEGVVPPYDVYLKNGLNLRAYLGCTRPDPVLKAESIVTVPRMMTSGYVTINGAQPPTVTGRNIWLGVATPSSPLSNGLLFRDVATFSGYVFWKPGSSNILGYTGYSWMTDADGLPTGDFYRGASLGGFSATDGGNISDIQVALQAVGSASLSGNISTPPSPYALASKSLFMQPSANTAFRMVSDRSFPTTFLYKIPDLQTVSYTMSATATASNGSLMAWVSNLLLGVGTSNIQLTLPAPVDFTTVFSARANIGPGTQLNWAARANTVYRVYISEWQGDGLNWNMELITAGNALQVPDTSADGIVYHPVDGQELWHSIRLEAYAPYANMDEIFTEYGLLDGIEGISSTTGFHRSGSQAVGPVRSLGP